MSRSRFRVLPVVVASLGCLALACVSTGPAELSLDEQIVQRGLDPAQLVFPAELTEEMRIWVEELTSGSNESARMNALLRGLLEADGLDLKYDPNFTATAAEVFESRRANCLSFTHLFVAMARAIDVDAYYLEVQRQPRFDREGDLVVVWEHVTAGFGPPHSRTVLEFALGPPLASRGSRVLSDIRAQSMYYSNRGAERLLDGDVEGARGWLETAVQLDPLWAQAWLNLGVARRRSGDLAGAEEAYLRALDANPGQPQAYHNLYSLLRLRGQRDAASEILGVLNKRSNRDPFISLSLGDASLEDGQQREARRFYRRALNLAPELAETHAAMGLLALAMDDSAAAERWLSKAERRDPSSARTLQLRRQLGQERDSPGTISE